MYKKQIEQLLSEILLVTGERIEYQKDTIFEVNNGVSKTLFYGSEKECLQFVMKLHMWLVDIKNSQMYSTSQVVTNTKSLF